MAANNSQLFIKAAILMLLVSLASGYFGTGPYEIKNVQLIPCEDQGTNAMHFSMQMYRTQDRTKRVLAHRGEFTWPGDNDKYSIFVTVDKWGTDWILVTTYEEELCKALAHMPEFFKDMNEAFGINTTACPYPTGRYIFEEWIVRFYPVTPVLPYGKYRSELKIKNGIGEVIGCMNAYCDVVQKFS